MNKIKFKDTWFDLVPGDGISFSGNSFRYESTYCHLTILPEKYNVEEIEKLINPLPQSIDIYNENYEKIMVLNGYSILCSIAKELGRHIYNSENTDEYIIKDVIIITISKPYLSDVIEQNSSDIELLNEAVQELASIIGE